MLFGDDVSKQAIYQEIFTCKMGDTLIKYLWMPVSNGRIRTTHRVCVTDKIGKKV